MSDRICAFARRRADEWVVAVAPRLLGELVFGGALPLGDAVWGSSALVLPPQAPRRWRDLMTQSTFEVEAGNQLLLGNLFRDFPVCLLYHEELPGGAAARAGDTNAAAAQHNV